MLKNFRTKVLFQVESVISFRAKNAAKLEFATKLSIYKSLDLMFKSSETLKQQLYLSASTDI